MQPLSPMAFNRSYATTVVLPDGKVLVMGGQVSTQGSHLRVTDAVTGSSGALMIVTLPSSVTARSCT